MNDHYHKPLSVPVFVQRLTVRNRGLRRIGHVGSSLFSAQQRNNEALHLAMGISQGSGLIVLAECVRLAHRWTLSPGKWGLCEGSFMSWLIGHGVSSDGILEGHCICLTSIYRVSCPHPIAILSL